MTQRSTDLIDYTTFGEREAWLAENVEVDSEHVLEHEPREAVAAHHRELRLAQCDGVVRGRLARQPHDLHMVLAGQLP